MGYFRVKFEKQVKDYEQKCREQRKKRINVIHRFLTLFNWLHIAIVIMVAIGVGILLSSYWIADNDLKNIFVGLGTGIMTSALVSLYTDSINRKIEKRELNKYKNMLLNPLYNAVKTLYVHIVLNINVYRVREDISGYFFDQWRRQKLWLISLMN